MKHTLKTVLKKNSTFAKYNLVSKSASKGYRMQRSLWHVIMKGGSREGAIAPLKPKKVILFTIILYNAENKIRDVRPFHRRFVTTVLWSILQLLQWRSCYETWPPNIIEIASPKLTSWIRPLVIIKALQTSLLTYKQYDMCTQLKYQLS